MSIPKLSDYKEVVGRDVVGELYTLASHVGSRSIKMVNSTAVGGGVAEMLHRVVPLLNELGIGQLLGFRLVGREVVEHRHQHDGDDDPQNQIFYEIVQTGHLDRAVQAPP